MTAPPRTSNGNLGDRAAKARAHALVGTVLSGRYKIVDLLAMGGVGAVYLGEHLKMHKHVAIKVLHPDAQSLPDIIMRFEREAVAGAHIQHPNVAVATDFGELEDGTHFLVLEYVKGTTLREVVKRGPLSTGRAVGITRQIAAALGATHAAGIVHRDVKPRNVMLIEGERDLVKLIDFGLAKLSLKEVSDVAKGRESMSDQQITTSGAVFGTIAYLAPEAALGMDAVDARADLYALGLVLYEMLAGKHPFDTSDPVALFKHHARTVPPPIAERAPGVSVPPAVESVVLQLLAKRREDRLATAEAVIAALDAAWEGATLTPPPAPVSSGEMFPGPSILPPMSFTPAPPSVGSSGSVPPSVVSRPSGPPSQPAAPVAPPSQSTPLPQGPVSTAPATTRSPVPPASPATPATPAVQDLVPDPPAPQRARWPYVAGIVGLALAATAVWWPSGDATPNGIAGAATSSAAAASATVGPQTNPSTVPATTVGPQTNPSATPTAPVVAMDPGVARATLRKAAIGRDTARGAEAFYALAEREPAAFHEPAVAIATRDLASALALVGGAEADRFFAALGHKLGGDGLDILYEIVRVRGGSKAATMAEAQLREPGAMDRATPALRATWTLRDAPCPEKASLLDKATADGDVRTLTVLTTTVQACLGPQNEALKAAIKALAKKGR